MIQKKAFEVIFTSFAFLFLLSRSYEYDAMGKLTKVTDPLNHITQIFYDKKGNKIREVDAENKEKTFEYDENNNLIKTTDALVNETLFEYNADNKMIKQTDAEGKIVRYEYDLDGRLAKTIDGNGNEIQMEYEDSTGSGCSSCPNGSAIDQPSRITYPTFAKEFTYDKRGRKIEERDVLSETETYIIGFDFDAAGNLIARTDKEDRPTDYEYDDLNRLKSVTDALGNKTEYFYDNRDNLTALTDANDNTTWFEYDRNNRLKKEIRPEGEETTYQYDVAGNLVQKLDAKNQKTEYVYDDAGRLVEIKYFSDTDHATAVKTVSFTYDNAGNLKTYDDGVTTGQYGYDDAYRKISETVNYGTFQLSNSYTYYKNGLKKSFTGPDGVAYEYAYDSNNQLTGVQIPGAGSITFSSYTWNRPDSVTLPGGSKRDYTYDPLMRVKLITSKDPGQNILLNYQYNYDKVDNIVSKTTEHGNYGYGYDALYRLTGVDNPVQADEGFTYDAVGNRLTAEGVADGWSYNNNNELQGYDGVSFQYDANGNTIQKNDNGVVTNYIYNIEDRLERVEDGSGSLISTYYYDPFGRRLWKEVGGVRTNFFYADEGLIGEYDQSGAEIKIYGFKPGSTWSTDPLFMKQGSEYYFYQNDHLGTPQKMTAVNGAVVWSAKYSSFGLAAIEINTVENNLRLPGQYLDPETGLHYNYFRYYDPALGRYLRTDPLFSDPLFYLFGISINPNNRYNYVKNSPIKLADPVGLMPKIQGGGMGWEVHGIYGYGRDTFYCCDGCYVWRIRTSKHCLGASFLASGGGTAQFTGSEKSNTCPEGY